MSRNWGHPRAIRVPWQNRPSKRVQTTSPNQDNSQDFEIYGGSSGIVDVGSLAGFLRRSMAASFWLRKFQYPDSSPRVEKACGAVAKKPERVEKVSLTATFF